MQRQLVVFAERFQNGEWTYWEHACDADEECALEDSATAKALERGFFHQPVYIDYLRGAEYVFNVVCGRSGPTEGDTRVFAMRVDKILIAEYEKLTVYSGLKKIA